MASLNRAEPVTSLVGIIGGGFAFPDSGTHETITRPLLPVPYSPNEMRIASSRSEERL